MAVKHSFADIGLPNAIDLRNVEDVGGTVVVVKSRNLAEVETAGKTTAPKAVDPKKLASPIGTILLPLPKALQFSDSIQYDEESRWLQKIVEAGVGTVREVGKMANNTYNNAFENTDLTTVQPGKMSRYSGHAKNSFNLDFDMHPRNAEWAKLIYRTIYALRYFSLPKFDNLKPGERFNFWGMEKTEAATNYLYEACLFDVAFAFGDLTPGGAYDKKSKWFPYLEDAVIKNIREDLSMNITPVETPSKTILQLEFEEVLHRHGNYYEKPLPSMATKYPGLEDVIRGDIEEFGDFASSAWS